ARWSPAGDLLNGGNDSYPALLDRNPTPWAALREEGRSVGDGGAKKTSVGSWRGISRRAIGADLSRQYEISTSLLCKWRLQALATENGSAFARAIVVDEPSSSPSTRDETAITVGLGGVRVSMGPRAPAALVTANHVRPAATGSARPPRGRRAAPAP